MTVKELIEKLKLFPENAIVRYFYLDEYGESYPEILKVEKISVEEFSDPDDYAYLENSVILKEY